MPEYDDGGLILGVSKHGENGAVVTVFSKNHGLQRAYCQGAFSKKNVGVVQAGNVVSFHWSARLEEQLGRFRCDLIVPVAARLMADADALCLSGCVCALTALFPEREPVPDFYDKTLALLLRLNDADCRYEMYARWERDLLAELGFGLDLSCCAVTGTTKNLAFVSPKSGRAVSIEAGEPWRDKLLPLPSFLLNDNQKADSMGEIRASLTLTGFFLEKFACPHINSIYPAARRRLTERMAHK